ncbi:MAG: fatty acid desaturase [Bdellovibrionota bacterium]
MSTPATATKQGYLTAEELAACRKVSNWRGALSILWTWGWIAAGFALYIARPGVLTFLVAWVVLSGRHLALAILMHDGAHGLLFSNKKWNDRLGQWLTGHPVLNNMLVYRMIHLQHHRHTWTKDDPDLALAKPFPITKSSFRRKVIRDLTGQTGYERYRAIIRISAGLSAKKKGLEGKSFFACLKAFAKTQKGFLITNGILLAAVSAFGHPEAYVLLWVIPAMTGFSLVLRIRSIAEHAAISDPTDELKQTRTTLAPGWVRFFMAPHNVNYHLEHHLYMYVPQYHLPKVHKTLKERGVFEHAEITPGYLAVIRRATSKPEGSAENHARASVLPFSGG